MSHNFSSLRFAIIALAALTSSGCGDPIRDATIEALPDDGLPNSPDHRAGQPCLACHGPYEGAEPELSVAGTLYLGFSDIRPAAGFNVRITDSEGTQLTLPQSLCSGNFFITREEFDPAFPIVTSVYRGENLVQRMDSRIGRDGSCSSCHFGKPSTTSVGDVILPTDDPNANCGN